MVEEMTWVKEVVEGAYYVSLINTIQRKKDGIIWVVRRRFNGGNEFFVDYVYWELGQKKFGLSKEDSLVKTIREATQEEKELWVK